MIHAGKTTFMNMKFGQFNLPGKDGDVSYSATTHQRSRHTILRVIDLLISLLR